ncbi:MAG: 3-deoxy-8-phosphooctulonate synthase [Paracoccaceae bacterium]
MSDSVVIKIGNIPVGGNNPLTFILGPCQLESRDHAMFMAEKIIKVCEPSSSNFIFKSSFDKANRSSIGSARGVGIEEGLKILEEVKLTFSCPVITDIHTVSQCAAASEVVDVLQIPAFLSRQTDLLIAAGETEKPINVKKGQFLAPWEMMNVAEKIASTGNEKILLCERGTSFGYNTLVNDFRGLEIMAETGYPVVFDATHSVQQPGGRGNTSGGERKFVAALARAACAVGVAAVFIETHQEPDNAPCDGPNMIDVADLQKLIEKLRLIDELSKAI